LNWAERQLILVIVKLINTSPAQFKIYKKEKVVYLIGSCRNGKSRAVSFSAIRLDADRA
jgi:hypothetical protein